ncbi:MAG: hypothetical protein HWN68_07475 [Desulfobacterales bacterium]|nr:hypothetical protein [Desulfobacterales bacterium]
MHEDILGALTKEVKEEVIENYLYDRRLIEEQINYVNELAQQASQLEAILYRRFARTYELLTESEFIDQFVRLTGLKEAAFEARFQKDRGFPRGLRFIKVRSFTLRARFKKLLLESYRRLFSWNKAYKKAHEHLKQEARAVNHNLKKFEDDHDLLAILNFLKDMDVDMLERKHFLGENFTPQEIASIEKTLRMAPIRIERFKLISPPDLAEPKSIQKKLGALADCVYGRFGHRIRIVVK